ncbi:MAG: alpha/beta hydrolase [Niabella sp.]
MKLRIFLLFALFLNTTLSIAQDTVVITYQDIDLWQKGLPNTNGTDHLLPNDKERIYKPSIRVYLPAKEKATGRAVVAYPGGGYSHLAYNHEGYGFAQFFTDRGIALIVLKYRMPNGNREVPFYDAEEAIRITKEHSKEWHIHPDDIGIMGSSAGGHLASTMATHFKKDLRPAFQILLYPVITMDSTFTHRGSRRSLLGDNPSKKLIDLYSNEKQVSPETPRAFIVTSDDDKTVSTVNSMQYYLALKRNGVPTTMHVYPSGGHGWGMKSAFKYHDDFIRDLTAWLNSF